MPRCIRRRIAAVEATISLTLLIDLEIVGARLRPEAGPCFNRARDRDTKISAAETQ
jgi:hypothetical protein